MTTRLARLFARLEDERGMALMLAIALTGVLGAISITVVEVTKNEQTRSVQSVKRDASFQAAEAGMSEYTAKMLDDGAYDLHNVHPAESTRRSSTGTLVGPTCSGTPPVCTSTAWALGSTWTYPSGKNTWRSLGNGYEYNLEVRPPSQGSNGAVSLLSTGRPTGNTDKRTWRTLFGQIRPAGVADFQMIADSDITYGGAATTSGKIYAAQDAGGTNHSVRWINDIGHYGTASADIYAEGSVTGSPTLLNGAQKYDSSTSPTVRTPVPQKIKFSSFLASLPTIKTAAQTSGLYLDATTLAPTHKDAWILTFGAGTGSQGTVTYRACSAAVSDGSATYHGVSNGTKMVVQDTLPPQTGSNCSNAVTVNLPANGAIYTEQTPIVSGTVNGQVTVASANDIVIGGNIYYNDKRTGCASSGSPAAQADDVLGLDATNTMWVPYYAPDTMTWCAATIAQTGAWQSINCANNNAGSCSGSANYTGDRTDMTFTGSTATEDGGSMPLFDARHYNYDPALLWIQPPWFPQIAGSYTVYAERELPGTFGF
jgi:Tfp pilus assembly protein PilX